MYRSMLKDSHPAACHSEFLEAALQYPKDVFILAEIMRLTPNLIAPYSSLSNALKSQADQYIQGNRQSLE